MSVVPTQEDVWPPVGGTGGNDGSQPGEAEAFASSGGGRRLYGPLSRPECGYVGGVSGPIAYSRRQRRRLR
jgi:hypothetical protein